MAQGVTIDFNANLARFSSAIDKATNDLSKFQKTSKRKAKDLTNVFKGLGVAIGAISIGGLATDIVNINRRFETLKTSLIAVTGSSRDAAIAFSEISKFARETPFQLSEVVTAFRKMSALGLEPSMEDLESFGNTASAMGRSLDQFIEAIADASTGEFERLKEFGIKTRKNGEQIQFTFQGVTKTVKNSAKDITGYLKDIGDVQFAGAMIRQMDTMDGAFSNLSDSVDAFVVTLGDSGLNSLIADLTNSFTDLIRESTSFLKTFQDASQYNSIQEVEDRIKSLNDTIKESAREIQSVSILGGISSIFSIGKDSADIVLATKEIERLKERLKELKDESVSFSSVSTAATSAIGRFVDGVIAAEPPVKKLGKSVKETVKDLSTMGRAMDLIDAEFEALDDQEARGFAGLLPEDVNETLQDLQQFSKDITDQFNPADAVARQLLKIEEAFAAGLISPEVHFEAVAAEMDKLGTSTEQTAEKMNEFAIQASRNIQSAFADFLFDPFDDGLKGLVSNFSDSLRRMAAEAASQQILSSLFGSFSGSGAVGGFFADMFSSLQPRALGGPVTAGAPYLVGEKGPELFMPKSSGRILPNGSAGQSVNQTINVSVSGNADRQSIQQLQTAVGLATSRAMRRNA